MTIKGTKRNEAFYKAEVRQGWKEGIALGESMC